MRNRKGFTLVELIVTLCVLAILAGIGVGAYFGYVKKAQAKACALNRTEFIQDYIDYVDLFESTESIAEYASSSVGDVNNLCPAGGVCTFGEQDGKAYVYCSVHDSDGSGSSGGEGGGGQDAEAPKPSWAVGTAYHPGDLIAINGITFVCTRDHTSGMGSATRNPYDGFGNKSTWRVAGFAEGASTQYSTTFRYEAGVTVTSSVGARYTRTNYNLNGGGDLDNPLYWTKED